MKIAISAPLTVAILLMGFAAFTSPTAAKRKHAWGYNANLYGRLGSRCCWTAMNRAGRGGRPGGCRHRP
jgi:hypothetical protein